MEKRLRLEASVHGKKKPFQSKGGKIESRLFEKGLKRSEFPRQLNFLTSNSLGRYVTEGSSCFMGLTRAFKRGGTWCTVEQGKSRKDTIPVIKRRRPCRWSFDPLTGTILLLLCGEVSASG